MGQLAKPLEYLSSNRESLVQRNMGRISKNLHQADEHTSPADREDRVALSIKSLWKQNQPPYFSLLPFQCLIPLTMARFPLDRDSASEGGGGGPKTGFPCSPDRPPVA